MRTFRTAGFWLIVPFIIATLLHFFMPRSFDFPVTAVVADALLVLLLARWVGFARSLPRRAPLARAAGPVTGFVGTLALAASAGVITAAGWSLWPPFLAFAGIALMASAAAIWWSRLSGRRGAAS